MTAPEFVLLIPVKASADAKSRLGLTREHRLGLRRAFAQDAIAAASASSRVHCCVVGDGAGLGDVEVLPDQGDGDLNVALHRAAARSAQPGVGIAAMLADLPCLSTGELESALGAAWTAAGRTFVADHQGTGTTLLAVPPGVDLDPRFGVDSAARHQASGAIPLALEVPTLRLDVDTQEDLERARERGVGRHTSELLGRSDRRQPHPRQDAERR